MKSSHVFSAILFSLVLIGVACTNSKTDESSSDMKEFTEDDSFKNAHDTPTDISSAADGKSITFPTPDDSSGQAFFIDAQEEEAVLFVIHEWWGLNDHIRNEAAKWADTLGAVDVYALDLYDGRVTSNKDTAGKYMNMVDNERAMNIIRGALKHTGDVPVMTMGWCFGGGWSLKAAIEAGDRGIAGVMYYGMPVQSAAALEGLEADILGLFAKKDDWITPEKVKQFDELMEETDHSFSYEFFDAKHAFANPSQPSYVEEAAREANGMAFDFLKKHLDKVNK